MRAHRVLTGILLAVACWMQWERDRGSEMTQMPFQVRQQTSADSGAVPPNPQNLAIADATPAKDVRSP